MPLVKFKALTVENTYIHPWWGQATGILLAFPSILPILLFSFCAIAKTPTPKRGRYERCLLRAL